MNEDLDGDGPQGAERAQQVTRPLSTKPVEDVSFTEHDEGLQRDTKVRGQRSSTG